MKWSLKEILWQTVCLLFYLLALWICTVNIQEIVDRARGHYTFFSQRANLSDGQAIVYCGLWTLGFIVLLLLSLKSLIKKRKLRAGMYAVILILLIAFSIYVDTLFYNPLV
jgi:hypothetical protein